MLHQEKSGSAEAGKVSHGIICRHFWGEQNAFPVQVENEEEEEDYIHMYICTHVHKLANRWVKPELEKKEPRNRFPVRNKKPRRR
jgi:hypothetical protein